MSSNSFLKFTFTLLYYKNMVVEFILFPTSETDCHIIGTDFVQYLRAETDSDKTMGPFPKSGEAAAFAV